MMAVAIGNSRCPVTGVGKEALEYDDLSDAGNKNDERLSHRPPGHVESESFRYVATFRLLASIYRLMLHYLCTA